MDLLSEACKSGDVSHVELALRACGKDVNKPNACEVRPLHLAVWRNHAAIVSRLLSAGANPDLQDGESGWSALHRSLYWGHLRVATQLLRAGASMDVQDPKGRTPLDLLSSELKPYMTGEGGLALTSAPEAPGGHVQHNTSVYCWGSGANYQLGSGSTDFTPQPVRVDPLAALGAVALAAAKYHSAAVGSDGRLWTWGWGRGGRLGHPDFNIHSGETALIQPWPVAGLGKRKVVCVAAGKHHMLVATSAGEVWSWGSGRHGKLGYGEVDTQPTPKRIAALQRVRVTHVAAAHKHSAALTSAGELYTWGANGEGQLGYGTSDSACNPSPRMVDALKGKTLTAVSVAKRHTVVLTLEGEPYTWGHQVVTPRRVALANCRDISRAAPAQAPGGGAGGGADARPGGTAGSASGGAGGGSSGEQLRFHRGFSEVMRPVACAIAAGCSHTTCVTHSGSVMCWWSADPALRVVEVLGPLAGVKACGVSASKYRTAVITDQGEVYVWEAAHAHRAGAGEGGGTPQAGALDNNPFAPSRGGGDGAGGLGTSAGAYPTRDGSASGTVSGSFTGGRDGVMGGSLGNSSGMALAGVALGRSSRRTRGEVAAPGGGGGGGGGGGAGGRGREGAFTQAIVPERVLGVKRVTDMAVGEKHSMALCSWSVPPLPDAHGFLAPQQQAAGVPAGLHSPASSGSGMDGDLEHLPGSSSSSSGGSSPDQGPGQQGLRGGVLHQHQGTQQGYGGGVSSIGPSTPLPSGSIAQAVNGGRDEHSTVESLQVLCQRVCALQLVEPRSALPLLEYADAAGAHLLRTFCLVVALRNLDLVLLESAHALLALPIHLVAELEQHYKAWLQPPRPRTPAHPSPSHPASTATTTGRHHTPRRPPSDRVPSTPPLGSSPISGSWIERAAQLHLGNHHHQPPTTPDLSLRRQLQLSKLQAPRRPTSVPSALDGGAADLQLQAGSQLFAHVTQAALAAIGHVPLHHTAPHTSSPTSAALRTLHPAGSEAAARPAFQPSGQEGAAEAEQAAQRLYRHVAKKLQQVTALEARAAAAAAGAAGAVALDGQQLAKISQKAALTDALHALESGAPLDTVQALITHAQDVSAKLAAVGAANNQPPGSSPAVGSSSSWQKQPPNRSPAPPADGGSKRKSKSQLQGFVLPTAPGKDGEEAESAATQQQQQQAGAGDVPVVAPSLPGQQQRQQLNGWHVNITPPAAHHTAPSKAGPASSKDPLADPAVTPVAKPAKRKGGLSMFLSGALEVTPKVIVPVALEPVVPRGPAWGGASTQPAPPEASPSGDSLQHTRRHQHHSSRGPGLLVWRQASLRRPL